LLKVTVKLEDSNNCGEGSVIVQVWYMYDDVGLGCEFEVRVVVRVVGLSRVVVRVVMRVVVR